MEKLVDLAEEQPDAPVLLLLTSRDVPGTHPCGPLLDRVRRSALGTVAHLAALDQVDQRELLRELGIASPSVELLEIADRSARGNPLRVRAVYEVLRHWEPGSPLPQRLPAPTEVLDPIRAWIEDIDEDCHHFLMATAVLGDRFSADGARRAADVSAACADAAIVEALRRGILRDVGEQLWFTHALLVESLYETLPPLERQRVHARCLDIVAAGGVTTNNAAAVTGGQEFSDAGDGLFLWFSAGESAWRCAVAIQQAFGRRGDEGQPLIRIGIAAGHPFLRDNRPYGLVVAMADRVCRLAAPQAIVLTEEVVDVLPQSTTRLFRKLPRTRLRNVARVRTLYTTG